MTSVRDGFSGQNEPSDPPSAPSTLRVRTSLSVADAVAGARILLVDPDGASRHFVEVALTKDLGLTVIATKDLEGAEEALGRATFDLVICETVLPDGQGQRLLGRVLGERRLENTRFVFLTADD